MKTWGIIFLVMGILNFVMFIITAGVDPEASGRVLSSAIMLGVIGAFMISRANKKEQEEKERNEWNK